MVLVVHDLCFMVLVARDLCFNFLSISLTFGPKFETIFKVKSQHLLKSQHIFVTMESSASYSFANGMKHYLHL
jgi:hypothetical protein